MNYFRKMKTASRILPYFIMNILIDINGITFLESDSPLALTDIEKI